MADAPCKAAACLAQCLYGIIVPSVRELADGIANLAANNQFAEDQYDKLIRAAIRFDKIVQRRKQEDAEFGAQLKKIAGLDT